MGKYTAETLKQPYIITSGKAGGSCLKRITAVVLAFVFLFSGCSIMGSGQNVEELLSPPKITQMQAEVVQALEEKEGGSIQLKAPANGEYIFPTSMEDIDGDGVQEIIVFYVAPQKGANVRIAILQETSNGYVVVGEEEGVSPEIEQFTVATFYANGGKQLVIGYQNPSLNEYYMVIYNCLDAEGNIYLTKVHEQAYSTFVVCDMTQDGKEDLLISVTPKNNTSDGIMLSLVSANKGELKTIAEYEMNNKLRKCNNMLQSVGPNQENIVVMDCDRGVVSSSGMASTAIYYENGKLKEYELLGTEDFVSATTRSTNMLLSMDLDEDGAVEVPVVMGAFAGAPNENRFLAVEWYDPFYSLEEPDCFGLADVEFGYFLKLPNALRETVYIEYNEESRNYFVRDIATGELVFDIVLLTKNENFTGSEQNEYTQLAMSGGYRVYIRIVTLSAEIDPGTLLSGFVILR